MPKKERKGLILAAGFGSRLEGVSAETSFKPLTPVAGTPLIFRTIESLQKAGCTGIVIVLGHGYKELKKAILKSYEGPLPLEFIYNDKFQLSNGVSVLSAAEVLTDVFIMTMADHVIGDSLMHIAGDHQPEAGTSALLVDHKIESIFDLDDATKVKSEEGIIRSIGKEITGYNAIDTGVFVCTGGLLDALDKVYKSKGDVSISDGVQELAVRNKIYALDIGDGFWQDVDTPEMLAHTEQILRSKES